MTELNLESVATEGYLEASQDLDKMSALEIVQLMNREEMTVRQAVESAANAVAVVVDKVAQAFYAGHRLFYVGAGTSGRLGLLDASECPPTFGSPAEQVQGIMAGGLAAFEKAVEHAEDRPEDGAAELTRRGLTKDDCVVGISASGRTPFVLGALEEARRIGAFTAAVFCNPGCPMEKACDQAILIPTGPEVVTGSTRLKAGTATKLILNQITTGAMIRSGRVLGNLMISLTPSCEKLVDRSLRILAKATDCSRDEAAKLLESAGQNLPLAILLGRTEMSVEDARLSLKSEPLNLVLQRLEK